MEDLDEYVYNELENVLLNDRNYVTPHKYPTEEIETIAIDSGVKLVIHPQQTQRVEGYFTHCRFTLQLTGTNLEKYIPILQDAIESILETDYGEKHNEDVWMPELNRENEVMGSAFGYYQAALDTVEATLSFGSGTTETVYVTRDALNNKDLLYEQLSNWWWPQLRETEKQDLVFEGDFEVKQEER